MVSEKERQEIIGDLAMMFTGAHFTEECPASQVAIDIYNSVSVVIPSEQKPYEYWRAEAAKYVTAHLDRK
jgi:hypothetical protein